MAEGRGNARVDAVAGVANVVSFTLFGDDVSLKRIGHREIANGNQSYALAGELVGLCKRENAAAVCLSNVIGESNRADAVFAFGELAEKPPTGGRTIPPNVAK